VARPLLFAAVVALAALAGAAPQVQAGVLLVNPPAASPGEAASPFPAAPASNAVLHVVPVSWVAPVDDRPDEDPTPADWTGWAARAIAPAPVRGHHRTTTSAPQRGPAALPASDVVDSPRCCGAVHAPDAGPPCLPFATSIFRPPRSTSRG
jgi:hypothetical protein